MAATAGPWRGGGALDRGEMRAVAMLCKGGGPDGAAGAVKPACVGGVDMVVGGLRGTCRGYTLSYVGFPLLVLAGLPRVFGIRAR